MNYSEPFVDSNDNGVYEPALGETFQDVGLDGVAGTGDFGEGNGQFDYDPDRAHVLAEDPTSRLAATSATDIATQRIYMDVGIKDEFGFARHYDNLVRTLREKGLTVGVQEGFGGGNCADLPDNDDQFRLVRYDAGHVGVAKVDPDDLQQRRLRQRPRAAAAVASATSTKPPTASTAPAATPAAARPRTSISTSTSRSGPPRRGDSDGRRPRSRPTAAPCRRTPVYRPYFHRTDRQFPSRTS